MNKTVEYGRQHNHPLSDQGKLARYEVDCSDTAAYVVDQLYVAAMLASVMLGLGANETKALARVIETMRDALEYFGSLERQVGDLREQLVAAEAKRADT